MSNRKRFAADLRMVEKTIDILTHDIDNLGELGIEIAHSEIPDQIGCYASSSLQGTLALLREMERVVLGPGKRKGRRS